MHTYVHRDVNTQTARVMGVHMRVGWGCSPEIDAGFLPQSLTEFAMCYLVILAVSLKHPPVSGLQSPVSSLHLPGIRIAGVLLHAAFYIGPQY